MSQFRQLLHVASSGGQDRSNAEEQLKAFQKQNAVEYIMSLCNELSNADNPPNIRHFAGILLGHAMEGDNAEDVQRGWGSYEPGIQNAVKERVMAALVSPEGVARKSAALVIAKIAVVEFANNQWNDLVRTLVFKIGQTQDPELCASIVLCLKYLMEEAEEHMQSQTGAVLDALKHCFARQQAPLYFAVFDCLVSTVDMFRIEMSVDQHRNDIMFMLCTAAGYEGDMSARSMGFMALAKLMQSYYDSMDGYIRAVFDLTKTAIEKVLAQPPQEDESVARQAIEFWSVTADTENEILEGVADPGTRESRPNRRFTECAVDALVPLYLQFLMQQNDELDDDTWTISKTAACSLEAFAKVAGPNVLQHVGKFMEDHISQPNWRSREAAMCAFALCINKATKSVIDKPLQTVLKDFMPRFLRDDDPKIRRTTAWTLGLVCQHAPHAIDVALCLKWLANSINDVNAVSHYACWCMATLAENFGEQSGNPITNQSQIIVQVLMDRSLRQDANSRVVQSVHEAINNIIAFCNISEELLVGFLVEFLKHLQQVVNSSGDPIMKSAKLTAIYSSISVTIQTCTVRQKELSKHICDQLMTCSLTLIESTSDLVFEEALLAFSALGENIRGNFVNYLQNQQLCEILLRSITDPVHYPAMCRVGAGTLGDIYRYGGDMAKHRHLHAFTDKVVQYLLRNMVTEELDIAVKSHVIDALADIGLSFGPDWKRYTEAVMKMSLQGGCLPLPENADEYVITHFNAVRVSIVDVCRSTLLACMSSDQDLSSYHGLLMDIFRFLELIAMDKRRSDECVQQSIRYLSEMINANLLRNCPEEAKKIVFQIQQAGAKSDVPDTRKDAQHLGVLLQRM